MFISRIRREPAPPVSRWISTGIMLCALCAGVAGMWALADIVTAILDRIGM